MTLALKHYHIVTPLQHFQMYLHTPKCPIFVHAVEVVYMLRQNLTRGLAKRDEPYVGYECDLNTQRTYKGKNVVKNGI